MAHPAYPVEPPKRKRSKWLVVVAVVAVVAIGAGVGIWLLRDGSGGDPSADLPKNPDLPAMSFPDPDSFGYAEGPEAMCAALDEVLSARGYLLVSGKRTNGGQYCRFITPGLSMLKDGSNEIRVDLGVWRDTAEDRYASLQSSALEQSQAQQNKPDYAVSKVERFPVGDAGFIYHREGDRADTEAHFRAGGDLMMVSVWGTVLVSSTSDVPETKPLTEEITYREITDIIASLTGGEPGPPQITAPELAQSPALAGLANLTFPAGMTVGDACAKVVPVAGTLGMKQKTSGDCGFEQGSDNWRDYVEGYTEREMTVGVRDYPPEGNIVASEEMARDLRSWLRIAAGGRPCGPLYELPFAADTGYATYCGNSLHVGFVLDRRIYVSIDSNGFRKTGGDLVPLPEDEVLGNLATVLTAMGG